jgi:hypothetical protein
MKKMAGAKESEKYDYDEFIEVPLQHKEATGFAIKKNITEKVLKERLFL